MTYRRHCKTCGKYWVRTGMDKESWKYLEGAEPKIPDKTEETICPTCWDEKRGSIWQKI